MATRSLGQLTIDLIAKIAGFEQGMDRAARISDKRMKEIERRVKAAGVVVGAALAGVVTASANQLRLAIEGMDELSKAAQRVSLPTEQFSGLVYAGKLADVELTTLVTSLGRLTKAQADAERSTSEQARTFDALGIATKDAEGKLRSSLDVLYDFADAFKRQEGSPEIVAAGIKIFGRSFQNLIPLIKDGSQGLKDAADEASAFGQIISTETGRDAEAFNDNLSRMGMLVSGLANAVAAELLPDLRALTDEWVRSAKEGDKLTSTAKDIADAIRGVVNWMREGSQVGASFRQTLSDIATLGDSYKAMASSVFRGDLEGFRKSEKEFYDAGKSAWSAAIDGVEDAKSERPAPSIEFITPESLFAQDKAAAARMKAAAEEAARLRKLAFGDAPKTGGGNRKSDEERAAERLQSAYESLMGSMHQRIALLGQEGEAVRVRYEIEHGSLKGLSAALAEQAVARAEQIDSMERMAKLQEAAAKAAEEETRRIADGLEAGKQLLADLQFELELMRMTNAERATAIQLRGLEAEAVKEYGEAIAEANRRIEEEMATVELMDGARREFASFIEDVFSGTKSIGDAFRDMLDNINRMIMQRIADNWVEQLFGAMGTNQGGSAGGNWFSTIMGMFAGGRATGGWVGAGHFAEVNERGIEMATVRGRDYLLTGGSPVEITPNHRLGMGRSVNVTQQFINPVMADRRSDTQRASESARRIREAQRNA